MNVDFKKFTEKITLPIAIIVAVIVVTIGYYAVQINKQKSIERQQMIELEQQKQLELTKTEQAKKEFSAKRKKDCLDIYETEGKKWNNVRGWRYSEIDDLCYVRYSDPNPKTKAECDENYPTGGDDGLVWLGKNILCKDGEFENSF